MLTAARFVVAAIRSVMTDEQRACWFVVSAAQSVLASDKNCASHAKDETTLSTSTAQALWSS